MGIYSDLQGFAGPDLSGVRNIQGTGGFIKL